MTICTTCSVVVGKDDDVGLVLLDGEAVALVMTLRPGLIFLFIVCLAPVLLAQDEPAKPRPEDTEIWKPEPPVVTPGPAVSQPPPSDAIVLFDGKNIDEWVTAGKPDPGNGPSKTAP